MKPLTSRNVRICLLGLLPVILAPVLIEAACIQGDCVTGMGVYTWPDGTRYEGGFRDTRFAGQGIYTWPDGRRYEGRFRNGRRHGRGIYTWPSGSRYEGQWKAGRRHGLGTYQWPDGSGYQGQWAEDAKSGLGIYNFADGHVESGRWQDDVLVTPMPSSEVARQLKGLAEGSAEEASANPAPAPSGSVSTPVDADSRPEPVPGPPPPPPPASRSQATLDGDPIQLKAEGQIIDGVGTNLTAGGGRTVAGHLALGLERRSPEIIGVTLNLSNTSTCRLQFEGWMMIGDVLERVVDWRGDQSLVPGTSRRAEAVVALPSNIESLNLRFQPKGRLAECR